MTSQGISLRQLLIILPFLLAGCNFGAEQKGDESDNGTTIAATDSAIPATDPTFDPSPSPNSTSPAARARSSSDIATGDTSLAAPLLVPESQKGVKGARNVLLAWGSALENMQFDKAYAQLGDNAKRGLSRQQFIDRYSRYRTITVAMPNGRMEGAAGSSYYSAPTTITGTLKSGGKYKLEGRVVLRRVNDVPGSTEEQLRWHIYATDLKPAPAN